MWSFYVDRLVYEDDSQVNHIPFLIPDYSSFSGEIIQIPEYSEKYIGYDDWASHFRRGDEIALVQKALEDIQTHPTKRIHIRGLSTLESIDLIREYYGVCGYEDELAKNYALPPDVRLTISVSLSHILWCEKDKGLLDKRREGMEKYGKTTPPVRSPADLRVLQQAVRMGIIMGIELSEHEKPFLSQIFEKQICSLFELSQMLYFRWGKYGFGGEKKTIQLELTQFTDEGVGD